MPSKKEKEAKKQQKKAEKQQKAEAKQRQKQPPPKLEVRHVVGQLPPAAAELVHLRNPRPTSLPVAPGPRPESMNSQRSMASTRSLESPLRTPGSERSGSSIPLHLYAGSGIGQLPHSSPQSFAGYVPSLMNQPGVNGHPLQQYPQGVDGQIPWQYQPRVSGNYPLQYPQGVNTQPPTQYQQGVGGQSPSQYHQLGNGQPLQYQHGANGQPPLQYQQGANGPPLLQYQQGANGQPPLQYQQGANGQPPLQYQQGANGQPPLQYQQGANGQPLQYQQGANGQVPLHFQQGVSIGQPPIQYQQGISGHPPLQTQQNVIDQAPQRLPQGANGQPLQQHPPYGHVINGGQRDSYYLPEADYDQGDAQLIRERFRPPTSSGKDGGHGATTTPPSGKGQETPRSSGGYALGRQYGSPSATINKVFSTQLNTELRSKIEEKRQEIPENDDDWQFGKGKDQINPDLKTHQTMIHAKRVANILSQEISQRKPQDPQQVAYWDPNVY